MANTSLAVTVDITMISPSETPTVSKPDFNIPRYIYFYGLSIILPVGLVCNLIVFGVFLSSKSLRKTTTGHYLIALAVADTIFLLGELLRWLNSFTTHEGEYHYILGITFMETSLAWCQITFYLRYAGKLASSWITVAIAGERFLTVTFPLKIASMSTTKIARTVICLIYLICFALGSYPFWTVGLMGKPSYCAYINPDVYHKWSLAILRIGSLLLPSFIIFILTSLILYFLHTAKKRRSQLEIPLKNRAAKSMDAQLTIMLVTVAIAFLVLRLPYSISYYINDRKEKIWGDNLDPWFSYHIYVTNKICDMIAISNYAVNFILYCLCGSAFRSKLKKCITLKGGRKRVSSSIRTMSSKLSSSKRSPPPPHRL